jgi:hypothetical protein
MAVIELPPSTSGSGLAGVTLTGTPSVGQVPTATSSSAATWQTPPSGGGGISFAGEAQGDLAIRGSSAWGRLAAGTAGAPLITGGSGANPAWGSSVLFGSGILSLGANPSSASGQIRLTGGAAVLLAFRNNGLSADVPAITTNTANDLIFGGTGTNITAVDSGGGSLQLRTQAATRFQLGSSQATFLVNSVVWNGSMTGPIVTQDARANDAVAAATMTITAQNAWASATTYRNGGPFVLSGGGRSSTSGRRGPMRLGMGATGTTIETHLEACDVQPEATSPSRVLSLLLGAAVTTTEMPTGTGDKVIFLANCAVEPTVNPVGGVIIYAHNGALKGRGSGGGVETIVPTS